MSTTEHLPKGIYRRDSTDGQPRYYVRIMVDGRYQRFSPRGGFADAKKAAQFLKHARADIERGKFFPEKFQHDLTVPLKELIEEQTTRIPVTANTKNDRVYQAWWLEHYGRHDARLITPAHLDQARATLLAEKKSPQTIHHYLKFLRHRLALAMRDDILERSPFQKQRLPTVRNLRTRFYSAEERQKLYAKLDTVWREAAELAGLTGLRWSEQFKLTREQVHLDEGFIELRTTKAGRPQARMLNARAVELLRAQLARHTTPWVYPNVGQYGPIDQSYFTRYIWIPARKEAGVGNARWNDWRHTFASDLTMAGHSDRTVATLLGHTSTQMVARYAHLADAHLRQAVESLAAPPVGNPGQKLANSPPTKPKKPRK
jgi:site-specific recombinase XerD